MTGRRDATTQPEATRLRGIEAPLCWQALIVLLAAPGPLPAQRLAEHIVVRNWDDIQGCPPRHSPERVLAALEARHLHNLEARDLVSVSRDGIVTLTRRARSDCPLGAIAAAQSDSEGSVPAATMQVDRYQRPDRAEHN